MTDRETLKTALAKDIGKTLSEINLNEIFERAVWDYLGSFLDEASCEWWGSGNEVMVSFGGEIFETMSLEFPKKENLDAEDVESLKALILKLQDLVAE